MKRALALIAATALLTACATTEQQSTPSTPPATSAATSNPTMSEAEKQVAFGEHICARDLDSNVDYATEVAVRVLADPSSPADDKKKALQITTGPDDVGPSRALNPDGDDQCHGWVWEHHIMHAFEKEYSDFHP